MFAPVRSARCAILQGLNASEISACPAEFPGPPRLARASCRRDSTAAGRIACRNSSDAMPRAIRAAARIVRIILQAMQLSDFGQLCRLRLFRQHRRDARSMMDRAPLWLYLGTG